MKKYKNKIILVLGVVLILAAVFWWGGNSSYLHGWNVENKTEMQKQEESEINVLTDKEKKDEKKEEVKNEIETEETKEKEEKEEKEQPEKIVNEKIDSQPVSETETGEVKSKIVKKADSVEAYTGDIEYSEKNGMKIDEKTGTDKYKTEPVPENKPVPSEPKNTKITDKEHTCTLSVRCDVLLNNIEDLEPEKVEIVPKDGIIFAEKEVVFYEGESVFNLLLREMKKNKIHMEFVNTPVYNSAYIEGIANLYEFDCGELSGWLYKVNDWFPNYGCSRYLLEPGDKVEWVYTCNMGKDVGGYRLEAKGQKDE